MQIKTTLKVETVDIQVAYHFTYATNGINRYGTSEIFNLSKNFVVVVANIRMNWIHFVCGK